MVTNLVVREISPSSKWPQPGVRIFDIICCQLVVFEKNLIVWIGIQIVLGSLLLDNFCALSYEKSCLILVSIRVEKIRNELAVRENLVNILLDKCSISAILIICNVLECLAGSLEHKKSLNLLWGIVKETLNLHVLVLRHVRANISFKRIYARELR